MTTKILRQITIRRMRDGGFRAFVDGDEIDGTIAIMMADDGEDICVTIQFDSTAVNFDIEPPDTGLVH